MGMGFLWGMMKNQDSFHREGQSTDANADMTQILEGTEEDLKAVAIQIFESGPGKAVSLIESLPFEVLSP